ncbi:DNA polymerase III subunit gamma/tau [Candidatus Steffania adelgidicola]|uniref:DNA polymerase III subunit gamma/tau n=1 Tax=Candidatus Steffania adelgidicola TaxID=1076626 RepID=UPI001D00714E|nr:DNA polymerase III subunit gamma/tau [Candidatus Steffania adelgidicola]
MSYQVLARKWRPKMFSDVVGQEHVLMALKNSLSLRRIHHAYLLSGTRGVGKTTIARLLVKGLNCETGITAIPCGQCNYCIEIERGSFIDLIEIDAASRTKVEDIRELLDNVQYSPTHGRFKIYLIDEVHMLSRHSFNALLKTLEEPPGHVKFLLATTDPQKLPVTVLSRCLQFHLQPLSVEQIYGKLLMVLQKEHISAELPALHLLASAAVGSMRDALSLTDQAIAMGDGAVSVQSVSMMLGMLNTEQPLALIETLVDADGIAMMAHLSQCAAHGIDWDRLLLEMLSCLHSLAIGQLLPDHFNNEKNRVIRLRLRELTQRLSPSDLQVYYQTLLKGRKELPFAPNPKIGVEMTLLRALSLHSSRRKMPVIPVIAEKKTAKLHPGMPFPPIVKRQKNIRLSVDSFSVSEIAGDNPMETEYLPVPEISVVSYISGYSDSQVVLESEINEIDVQTKVSRDLKARASTLKTPEPLSLQAVSVELLQARNALLCYQKKLKTKKEKLELSRQKATGSVLPILDGIDIPPPPHKTLDRVKQIKVTRSADHYWGTSSQYSQINLLPVTIPKAFSTVNRDQEITEFFRCLTKESLERDPWAAQVYQLVMPELIRQFALNTWKENLSPGEICLHFRTSQRHLNSMTTHNTLHAALSDNLGFSVKLAIIEDDNPAIKTPMEWRQVIYQEKLMRAREVIMTDSHIEMLRNFFDAELDEDTIRPI